MERFSLPAIAAGTVVAVVVNLAAALVVRFVADPAEISITAPIIIAVVGFVAYLIEGYIAGRMVGGWGGLNGLAVVVVGFLVGIVWHVIISAAAIGGGGANVDPASVEAGTAAIATVISIGSFLLNFLIGYLGGQAQREARLFRGRAGAVGAL